MSKIKKEVNKWINIKLPITLDFNNQEEHKLLNILDKLSIL